MTPGRFDRFDRSVTVATYAVLLAVGILLGAIGSFLVPLRLFSGVEGLSVVIALIGNLGVGLLGGIGLRSALGALAPAVGWFVAVGMLTMLSFGGDVVVPGELPTDPGVVHVATAYLLVGVVSSLAAIAGSSRYTKRANTPKPSP